MSRKYFGNAAHFICGDKCRFHIATKVGRYLVSTVGELWPERTSREIHADVYDAKWLAANRHRKGDDFDYAYMQRFGYEDIGCDRKYETMVFKAGAPCTAKDCGCGMPSIASSEIDFAAYNDRAAATKGHEAMCRKYERPAKRRSRRPHGGAR